MLWRESGFMDQRLDFLRDAMSSRFTIVELYARYGMSRHIGYKWLVIARHDRRRAVPRGHRELLLPRRRAASRRSC
jgi:hypothetical protein